MNISAAIRDSFGWFPLKLIIDRLPPFINRSWEWYPLRYNILLIEQFQLMKTHQISFVIWFKSGVYNLSLVHKKKLKGP